MNFKKLILVCAVALAATGAFAQGFRGGGGMMNNPAMLLNREDVKSDLNLTDDQKDKLAELRESMRSDFQAAFQTQGEERQKAMADLGKKMVEEINKILTADQQKRLKEISLQLGGFSAVSRDKDLQAALALTDDQKSKITDLAKQAEEANKAVGEKMANQELDRETGMAAFKKNNDALNASIEAILTADQKTKFKALEGKPFTATSQPGFGGRGGG